MRNPPCGHRKVSGFTQISVKIHRTAVTEKLLLAADLRHFREVRSSLPSDLRNGQLTENSISGVGYNASWTNNIKSREMSREATI
jgi:hypothetical protein